MDRLFHSRINGGYMIFPLLCISLIGLVIFMYGIGERKSKKKQAWVLIVIGLSIGIVGLGLFIFSLWVFASGM